MREKINWIIATQAPINNRTEEKPWSPPRGWHVIKTKHYATKNDEQPWSVWDVLKAVATFAIGSWVAWRMLDIFCGGGIR
jgi:hypothetical protein